MNNPGDGRVLDINGVMGDTVRKNTMDEKKHSFSVHGFGGDHQNIHQNVFWRSQQKQNIDTNQCEGKNVSSSVFFSVSFLLAFFLKKKMTKKRQKKKRHWRTRQFFLYEVCGTFQTSHTLNSSVLFLCFFTRKKTMDSGFLGFFWVPRAMSKVPTIHCRPNPFFVTIWTP